MGYLIDAPELLLSRSREAARIADPQSHHAGGVVRVAASVAHRANQDWEALLEQAGEAERFCIDQRANLWLEPFALGMQAIALIELDRAEAARERAEAAVGLSRKRGAAYAPSAYEALARCQLAQGASTAEISATVTELAALVERSRLATYLPVLEELRAALAGRDGDSAAEQAALDRARAARQAFQTEA